MAASVKGVERRFRWRKSKEEFVLEKEYTFKGDTHTQKNKEEEARREGVAPQTKHR